MEKGEGWRKKTQKKKMMMTTMMMIYGGGEEEKEVNDSDKWKRRGRRIRNAHV